MEWPGTLRGNKRGHLEIGGCDAVELAKIYGTPLYVFDEEAVRGRCREYREAFAAVYPDYHILYACKAFSTMGMCRLMEMEGLGLDVASGGELYTALAANYPPEDIYFHGNNKSIEELNLALSAGVGQIVVDNPYEMETLAQLAEGRDTHVDILLRLTPGVEAHTHAYIQTGQLDSKFGITMHDDSAIRAVQRALEIPVLNLKGIHCHIGSQVYNLESFVLAARLMVDFMQEVRQVTGHTLAELNLGGGLGIAYMPGDQPPPVSEYARLVAETVKERCQGVNLPLPRLLVEPGRSVVGEAAVALYRVGTVKEIPGVHTYASVDGGMADNPRPALYQASYHALVANKVHSEPEGTYTIAGKACESGDILIRDIQLPNLVPGDVVAVLSSGAYHYAMASNYNRLPRPAIIMASSGKAEVIVRRESLSDLVRYDRIPASWEKKAFLSANG